MKSPIFKLFDTYHVLNHKYRINKSIRYEYEYGHNINFILGRSPCRKSSYLMGNPTRQGKLQVVHVPALLCHTNSALSVTLLVNCVPLFVYFMLFSFNYNLLFLHPYHTVPIYVYPLITKIM
jgi:hypothetical protein